MPFSGDHPVLKTDFQTAFPPPWGEDPFPEIQRRATSRKLVVLDDDPTGTQTVHGLWVVTQWTPDILRTVLADEGTVFYILTNSRSLPESEAVALNRQIAANMATVAREVGRDFDLVSRSDSTLRGHFPGEIEALRSTLEEHSERSYDGIVLCPFFLEGGRLTADDVHWVAEGERLVPAAQTEFARDATFGYRNSNLCRWVEEKTRGRVAASDVLSVSLELIRRGGPEGVRRVLKEARDGRVVVVNAVVYRDLEVFVAGLLAAEAEGGRFLFRTAASFVKVRGGIPDRDLLMSTELVRPGRAGGLIVVGSYVQKSTRQLEQALELPGLSAVELSVPRVLDPAARPAEIVRAAQAADDALGAGQDVAVYTSRELATEKGRAGELGIGEQVSSALVEVVRRITVSPRFIVAKGGITSSDVATEGLSVRRAWVLGQILPGVPVWRLGEESRFPGLSYVVFPGNVGTDESLAEAVEILRA